MSSNATMEVNASENKTSGVVIPEAAVVTMFEALIFGLASVSLIMFTSESSRFQVWFSSLLCSYGVSFLVIGAFMMICAFGYDVLVQVESGNEKAQNLGQVYHRVYYTYQSCTRTVLCFASALTLVSIALIVLLWTHEVETKRHFFFSLLFRPSLELMQSYVMVQINILTGLGILCLFYIFVVIISYSSRHRTSKMEDLSQAGVSGISIAMNFNRLIYVMVALNFFIQFSLRDAEDRLCANVMADECSLANVQGSGGLEFSYRNLVFGVLASLILMLVDFVSYEIMDNINSSFNVFLIFALVQGALPVLNILYAYHVVDFDVTLKTIPRFILFTQILSIAWVTVYVLNVVSCYVSHFMIKFANRGAFKDKARAAQAKAATFDFLGTKQPEGFKLHRGLKHRSVRFDHIVKEKNV